MADDLAIQDVKEKMCLSVGKCCYQDHPMLLSSTSVPRNLLQIPITGTGVVASPPLPKMPESYRHANPTA